MKEIPIEIFEYLNTQKIGVVSMEMLDGSPHAATVHFAHTEHPFVFIIQTGADSRKCEALLKNGSARASFVVGVDVGDMKTLQLDGVARIAKPDEEESFMNTYLGKFPSKEGRAKDPKAVCVLFTPTWWRFTNWKTPEGMKILASE